MFCLKMFGGDALGKRFKTNAGQTNDQLSNNQLSSVTIVGVVDDVRHGDPEQEVQPEAFQPRAQGGL